MVDLTTTYMGLRLASPLVPSASPLSRSLDAVRRMEDFGAGAIVLHSLFQEQILRHEGREPFDPLLLRGPAGAAGGPPDGAVLRGYLPSGPGYWPPPDAYAEHVRRVKAAVSIPVIASLNGVAPGPWLDWAGPLEQAGADALEVGVYFLPADPALPGAAIEELPVDLVREVRRRVRIPVAAKLSPYYTNLPAVARRVTQAGAAALVLFSRFYQPDVDPQLGPVDPQLPAPPPRPTLSTPEAPEALRLPLRWIALLSGRVGADLAGEAGAADLAGSGGVHSAPDALKLVLAGASVAMLASELLRHGVGRLAEIRHELEHWLEEYGYESVAAARGRLSQRAVAYPAAYERAQYLRVAADPRARPTADHAPDRPTWQWGPTGFRGHLHEGPEAETAPRPPLTYDPSSGGRTR